MKCMLRAATMVLGIGGSVAYADGNDGYAAATLFTWIPGEQSAPPAATPRQEAITIPNGAVAHHYMTTSRTSTSLFPAAPDSSEH